MRLLVAFLLVLLVLPTPHVSKPTLTISPAQDYYFRGDEIVVSGKLVEPSGNPIPNATIYILVNGTQVGETTTRSDGSFSFRYQIPLSRPPGTLMNITAYYPGDLLHLPSYDNSTIFIYGYVKASCSRSEGHSGIEEHFEGPTTKEFMIYAFFDNGSAAQIDRYYELAITNSSGTFESSGTLNDTQFETIDVYLSSPSSVSVYVEAYVDFPGFLFKDGSKRKSFTLSLNLYEFVYISGFIDAQYVGQEALAGVSVSDEYDLLDNLLEVLSTANLRLITPAGPVEPKSVSGPLISDGMVSMNATFELPSFWGGDVSLSLEAASRPSYMKAQIEMPSVRVELLNISLYVPQTFPRGVFTFFIPRLLNELDGSMKLLDGFGSLNANATIHPRPPGYILLSESDVKLVAKVYANSSTVCFNATLEAFMRAMDVEITSNVSGTVRIYENENVSFYVEVKPRNFPDISAVANVSIGDTWSLVFFNGTLNFSVSGGEIQNGTKIIVQVGVKEFSTTIFLKAIESPPVSPEPNVPSEAAGGQTRVAVLTIALLVILIVLLVYLVYLILKRIAKRFSKPKEPVISEQERMLQRIRSLYHAGNYKLLAIEAYRFLTGTIAPLKGISIRPNDTPRRVAEKLIAVGVRASLVNLIVQAYEIARYSPWDLDEETAQQIVAAVATLIKEHLRPKTPAR